METTVFTESSKDVLSINVLHSKVQMYVEEDVEELIAKAITEYSFTFNYHLRFSDNNNLSPQSQVNLPVDFMVCQYALVG